MSIRHDHVFVEAARTAEMTHTPQYVWRDRIGRWRSGTHPRRVAGRVVRIDP